ncbi:FHA domain-containing protein [Lentzea flaviverrucosa]|uniref:FHA domain-containing protein n=1 Tax=Lentzea flaviverrucosa TaxID=200379 RepID=A0A1H9CCL3_9PSEU|nr:FHA domain-containing protein [Lentzea flaviverrucosa]RDI24512.1 FHA domain-containing protein [Lentzea flaviverrucosa]SEP98955.1 FHA domain-containing protein [Lentzea flaviverrucosa]
MSMRCPDDPTEVFSDAESFCAAHMCSLEPVVVENAPEADPSTTSTAGGARPERQPWSTKVCWHCDTESPVETNVECLEDGCGRSLTPPALYLKFRDGEVELDRGRQTALGRRGEHGHVFRGFPNVSRGHAVIGVDADGRAWISPSSTPNGTFVNGTELPPSIHTTLRCGDVIRFAADAEGSVTLYDL